MTAKPSEVKREFFAGYVSLYESEIYPLVRDYRGFTRLRNISLNAGIEIISSRTKDGNYGIEVLQGKPVFKDREDVKYYFYENNFCSLIYNKTLDADVFCDVGGYHGFYSIISEAEKNYVFEPEHKNRQVIKQHKKLNPDQDLEIVEKVAWKNKSSVSFESNGSQSHVSSEDGSFEAVSLDSYFSDKKYPDVVKIDAEGSELEVLQGSEQVIRNNRPTFFVEIHTENVNPDAVLEFFKGHGYKIGFQQRRGSEIQVMAY